MSNTLDFIQTYVGINTENPNLRKTDFKVKSCSEASLKTRYSLIVVTFMFIYFFKKKNQIALNINTHTQKSIENKEKKNLENVTKIKNIPIKGGGSSQYQNVNKR